MKKIKEKKLYEQIQDKNLKKKLYSEYHTKNLSFEYMGGLFWKVKRFFKIRKRGGKS